MALINKLTAIADAIRGKNGKPKGSGMTLEGMAAEIQRLTKCVTFTTAQDAGAGTVLMAADDLVKAHRADPSLFIAVLPLFSSEAAALKAAIATNREVCAGSYGTLLRVKNDLSVTVGKLSSALNDNSNNLIYVDADGSVVYQSASVPLAAGSYLVVCGWGGVTS